MIFLFSLLKGFVASGSLIVAIGSQNAFVIRQGLKQQHLLLTALLCALLDSMLILLGVIGFGNIILSYPSVIDLTKYLASLFLFAYGILSFRSALQTKNISEASNQETHPTVKRTILILIALSLLNPHAYLDTVVLLGAIASQYPMEEKIFFAMGAIGASFAWFFGITYGARFLSPLLQREISWRIIDILIGLIMWGLAATLLVYSI